MLTNKDLKYIAKQFSNSDKSLINFFDVYTSFLKPNGDVEGSKVYSFSYFDETLSDMLIKNFKKVFSGKVDKNNFCPNFTDKTLNTDDVSIYTLVKDIENCEKEEFKEKCDTISELIGECQLYDDNVVLIGLRCSILIEGVTRNLFVMSICKTKQGEKKYMYITDKEKFELTSSLDCEIITKSPIEGFAYPVLNEGTALKDRIMYYVSKSNKPEPKFLSKILGCVVELTAQQEDLYFHQILGLITDKKMNGQDMYKFYSTLKDNFSEEELEKGHALIDKVSIKKALEKCDINQVMDIDEAFDNTFGFDDYEFKALNVLPEENKKSIVIQDEDTDIKIKPEKLEGMKQIQEEDGTLYLMIPIQSNMKTSKGIEIPIEKNE